MEVFKVAQQEFDYTAPADLFLRRSRQRSRVQCRRFETAAEAIRFAENFRRRCCWARICKWETNDLMPAKYMSCMRVQPIPLIRMMIDDSGRLVGRCLTGACHSAASLFRII